MTPAGRQLYHESQASASSSVTEFNCKFSPKTQDMPPKYMPLKYLNDTMIMCASPSGFTKGDKMHLQVTFNGGDYDMKDYEFNLYNMAEAFPRSGPSDGTGGDIVISGQGFKEDSLPKCRLNGVVTDPISVQWD